MNDGRVHYARNGDARVAYRRLGDGDTTIVFVLGWVVCSIDAFEHPTSPYASAVNLFEIRDKII